MTRHALKVALLQEADRGSRDANLDAIEAGLRQAQVRQALALGRRVGFAGCFEAARQQQLQHHRAAVGLQLEHVFAGV